MSPEDVSVERAPSQTSALPGFATRSPIPAAASAAVVPFVPPRLNSSDSVRVNGFSSVGKKERLGCLIGVGNGRLGTIVGENKKGEEDVSETLEARF
ncbi:hypothetical protein LOK49_Contig434G00006 [Camellia lanceoleosa]|nr:hypothetical protein LOK49_Contig434G00006 [Camellia lanceoleosa]